MQDHNDNHPRCLACYLQRISTQDIRHSESCIPFREWVQSQINKRLASIQEQEEEYIRE